MPDATTPRSPLELSELITAAGPAWEVRLLEETPSTNAIAAAAATPGLVVVTDHQTAGRGRLDRVWTTPRGSALTFSTVVELDLPPARWPLLPLVVGLAVLSGVPGATLKWPNDVLIDGRKVAGILVELVGDPAVAVIGTGINVDMSEAELPVPQATSLSLAGVPTDRTELFGTILAGITSGLAQLRSSPSELLDRYRAACSSIGRQVEVSLPDGSTLRGRATSVDDHGRLVVDGHPLAAGDVIHAQLS